MTRVRLQLRLVLPDGRTFGPGKAELLERIAAAGSIAAAGRGMKMSYKRAWSLVEEMNAAFRAPLVTSGRGGAERGGAQVTELGRTVLAHYLELVARVEAGDRLPIDFIEESLATPLPPLLCAGPPVMSK